MKLLQRKTVVAIRGATVRNQLEGAVMGSQHEQVIVTVLRSAVRLSWGRFADPRESHGAGADIPGWRRDHGDGEFELWLTPAFWRAIFEPDIDGVEAAQVLDRLGLLRRQDDGNLQIMAKVGGRGARVYAIDGKKLAEFRAVSPKSFGGCGRADTLELASASPAALISQENPADPAALLHQGVVKGLRMAIDTLDIELDPSDRNYGALLRAKTALANTLITTQCRVDESKMRAKQADALLPALLESLKIEKARLAKVDFRRGFLNGEPIGAGMETPPDDESSA